jgi:hypothetical protein
MEFAIRTRTKEGLVGECCEVLLNYSNLEGDTMYAVESKEMEQDNQGWRGVGWPNNEVGAQIRQRRVVTNVSGFR